MQSTNCVKYSADVSWCPASTNTNWEVGDLRAVFSLEGNVKAQVKADVGKYVMLPPISDEQMQEKMQVNSMSM